MAIEKLLEKTDKAWYRELYDEIPKSFQNQISFKDVFLGSIRSAEECYRRFYVEGDESELLNRIKDYGVTVRYIDPQIESSNIAYYDDTQKELVIFEGTVNRLHQRIVDKGLADKISLQLFKNVILSHELYHMIEMNEVNIYSYSKLVEIKFLGLFKRKEQLEVASEIAAYHFSKLVNQLEFSPRIVELLHTL